ncbi:SPT3 Dosage dependent suppressor of Ty-induced promoter mutations-like protein [Rhizophlyctis rosea]|nr:SPT3 Dosage dependent suppressor of Ty-induced promoter mutations-like protein [Rhizophlyctis rosea]
MGGIARSHGGDSLVDLTASDSHSTSSSSFDIGAAKAKLDSQRGFVGKGLQIRILGVPQHNAKSRVETQVKICLQLVTDAGEKVGMWSQLRLPEMLLARERARKTKVSDDPDILKTILDLEALVVCASDIDKAVQTCLGCVQRERKRAKKKDSVRQPVKAENATDTDEENLAMEQKRVILFSSGPLVEFSSGDTIIPTRITCYCRHHNEKTGFCIYYVFRNVRKEIIATGLSPPIMITDDHKSAKQQPSSRKRQRTDDHVGPDTPSTPAIPSYPQISPTPAMPSATTFLHSTPPSPETASSTALNTPISPFTVPDGLHQAEAQDVVMEVDGKTFTSIELQNVLGLAHNSLLMDLTPPPPSGPPPPTITRVIPSEGPVAGGIEVTVLGSNFHDQLVVCFGGVTAVPTHFWSETTLVCMLPPSLIAGPVEVRVVDSTGVGEGEGGVFTYKDDSDRALMELALQVLGLRMTGKVEDARQIAMRIVANSAGGGNGGTPSPDAPQQSQAASLRLAASILTHSIAPLPRTDLELLIIHALSSLELQLHEKGQRLVLDEQKTSTGQTMLHLACMTSMTTLGKWLLSRRVEVNESDSVGMTPLHWSAWRGDVGVVRELCGRGARWEGRNNWGAVPSDLAAAEGHEDVVMYLEEVERRAVEGEEGGVSEVGSVTESTITGFEGSVVTESVFDGEDGGEEEFDDDADMALILDAVNKAADAGLCSIGGPPAGKSAGLGRVEVGSVGSAEKTEELEKVVSAGRPVARGVEAPPKPVVTPAASEAVAIAAMLVEGVGVGRGVSFDAFVGAMEGGSPSRPVAPPINKMGYGSAKKVVTSQPPKPIPRPPPMVRRASGRGIIPISAAPYGMASSNGANGWDVPSVGRESLLAFSVRVVGLPKIGDLVGVGKGGEGVLWRLVVGAIFVGKCLLFCCLGQGASLRVC